MHNQRYMLVNLIYNSPNVGGLYTTLWLENQLKSLLDRTNLPALREKGYTLEYVIFTDEETMMQISRHPNFMALSALCEITVIKLGWPADADRFGSRYGLLTECFKQTMNAVFNPADQKRKDAWVSMLVADLVFAKGALPKMLKRLEDGHDAVFNVPIRSAADSVNPLLARLTGAPTEDELFEMAYQNLHHLWTHSTWNNPYFSRMPYSMLWNSGTGLVAHNFGITPIVFKPSRELCAVRGVIDSDVPSFFKNPYWAEDWLDAPVAGVEPLSNGHYPPFSNQRSEVKNVAEWAQSGTFPEQAEYLKHPLFYPSRKRFNDEVLAKGAADIAERIETNVKALRATKAATA